MEGPLEVKHSVTGVEEPIKSEAPVQNSDNNERSDGVASPPPNCSICLGKLVNTSFTDSCLHQFCFTCLLKWSKIKTECPLCKQTFKSIIHNVRSEEDYDQYHVPPELVQIPQTHVMATLDATFDVGRWDVSRFFYRTTMTGNRRHGTLLNPEQVARREQLPSMAPQVPREERRRRRDNPTDYRRTVYRHGVWATALPDIFGRFRECSADYYRRQPQELDRLIPWLNRELQVLIPNNAHIAYVMNLIAEALRQYDIRSPEFRSIVRPYCNVHTDHFIHELLNFARTNFDIVGYDQAVTYLPRAGLSNEYTPRVVSPVSSSSSISSNSNISSNISLASDNSDIRILDEAIDLRVNTVMPNVLPFPMNQPGPSTVGQLLRSLDPSFEIPELLILSSSSSESDGECEIIGYVKPRHERTPEVIELLSSDSEQIAPVNDITLLTTGETLPANSSLPSTSYATVERSPDFSSALTSVDDNSDSDYNPCGRSQNHSKNLSSREFVGKKRKRPRNTRSRNKRSRDSYSSEDSNFKKRSSAKIAKNRTYSCSDLSSSESSPTKCDEKRSRKEKCYAKERMKLVKKEGTYPNVDSFDGDSSSAETDNKTKSNKCGRRYVLKKKRALNLIDYTAKRKRTTRSKERTLIQEKSKSNNKDSKCESRQSRSRSTSLSSNVSEQDQIPSYRHRESRGTNEHRSQDESASIDKVATKRQPESKSKSKACYFSDSEDDRLRSSSQCSNRSNKSYSYRKRSKHKDRHKDKDHNRSSSRTFNLLQAGTSSTVSSSTSAKNDIYPTKHSDCMDNHKSSRSAYKESKYRKSQCEKKSRSRKRRRRLRSPYTSQSE